MKLLIYGTTGAIGACLLDEALRRGHHVTAVVRDTARQSRRHERLTVVSGDGLDSTSVTAAARGHDVVLSAIGASPHAPQPDPSIYRRVAVSLTTALRRLGADAPRLIVVGGAGSLEVAAGQRLVDTPHFPAPYREDALGQAEALDFYRSVKDLIWTYVSPAALIEPGPRSGRFRVGGDRLLTDSAGNSHISTEDYAVALINEAESAPTGRRRISVAY